MLNKIELRNFKCFERVLLPLGSLTLLAGTNASGKSTVLQALVLLHQTMREHEWSTRLMLNGAAIQLGTVADIIDKVHGRRTWEIGISDADVTCRWTFEGDRAEMSMTVETVSVGGLATPRPERLRFLLPEAANKDLESLADRLRGLTFITAERVGPREVYSLEDRQASLVVGRTGEHAVSVLQWGRDEPVVSGLALEGVPVTRLKQVEERMRMFFPGFSLEVKQVPQTNSITLGIRTSTDTDYHRPVNVGFGLTQVFPIVVAAISAKKGDILLIENPEVHLHPAGQAKMGEFLSEVASAGIQIVVESHSDHILSGIRRSVKAGVLPPEAVSLNFFRPRSFEGSQVMHLQLDKFGGVDTWPDGFFDQFDKDMNHFAGWGK